MAALRLSPSGRPIGASARGVATRPGSPSAIASPPHWPATPRSPWCSGETTLRTRTSSRLRAVQDRRRWPACPAVDNAPAHARCRPVGLTLLGERDFEYPNGTVIRGQHWALDLRGARRPGAGPRSTCPWPPPPSARRPRPAASGERGPPLRPRGECPQHPRPPPPRAAGRRTAPGPRPPAGGRRSGPGWWRGGGGPAAAPPSTGGTLELCPRAAGQPAGVESCSVEWHRHGGWRVRGPVQAQKA